MYKFATNPYFVFASLALGAVLGLLAPSFSKSISFIGDLYIDLLKIIVVPFMISAVMFSLLRLLKLNDTGRMLKRTGPVMAAALLLAAAVGFTGQLVIRGSGEPNAAQMEEFGRIVGSSVSANDLELELQPASADFKPRFVDTLRTNLVPTNVFAALAQGDMLKILIFAMVFGLALGCVSGNVADSLGRGLEGIYQACQKLTRWFTYPLPIVLVCVTAGQLANSGLGPLQAMAGFVAEFALASALTLAICTTVIWLRSGDSLNATLRALKEPFSMAIATRTSTICMPAMVEALTISLRFTKAPVELFVPLMVSLLKVGPVVYYVCATLFVAHIYGRSLSGEELALLGIVSILAGCASAGMSGFVVVSLIGLVCSNLGLPFEAAFVLFLAIDPIADMIRTAIAVISGMAAVSLICDKPQAHTAFVHAPATGPAAA
jgi:Na+/H+-dicarboxylate symporter